MIQIKVIVTNDYKFSSNVNEVIIKVLNSLFIYFFFFTSVNKKHLKEKKLLICLIASSAFAWLFFVF